MFACAAAQQLEKYDDGCECVYWGVKFPWPLTNRDYVYFRRGKRDEETGAYFQVSMGGTHESRPATKKCVRVETYTNTMAMRDTGENTVEFVLIYYDDPNGSIPKAMINWAVSTAVPEVRCVDRV
jgi:StAR-related lipid transfer protein 7, mitochondrial